MLSYAAAYTAIRLKEPHALTDMVPFNVVICCFAASGGIPPENHSSTPLWAWFSVDGIEIRLRHYTFLMAVNSVIILAAQR